MTTTPFLDLVLVLSVVIAAAKIGGLLSSRLGQPAVLGELSAGLILGPSVIDLLHLPIIAHTEAVETSVHHFAELGVLVLMFVAGLEVDLAGMLRTGRVATYSGVLGVVFPLAGGIGLALAAGRTPTEAIFIGIVLTATSVSISAQTLMEMGVLQTTVGLALLAAAVVDDVLVILILSVFLAFAEGGDGGTARILVVTLRMVAYLVGAVVIGRTLLKRNLDRIAEFRVSEGALAASLVIMFLYAWSAEALGGVAAITGAFMAGLFMADSPLSERIEGRVHALAYGLLVPVFFVSVGLDADLTELGADMWPYALGLIAVAIVAKVLGSGLGAVAGGMSRPRALQVGLGMISRGEVGLIVAAVGNDMGVISGPEFTAIVVMVIVTTLVTPILLRWSVARWPMIPESNEATGDA